LPIGNDVADLQCDIRSKRIVGYLNFKVHVAANSLSGVGSRACARIAYRDGSNGAQSRVGGYSGVPAYYGTKIAVSPGGGHRSQYDAV
jgi:hypothetical protein